MPSFPIVADERTGDASSFGQLELRNLFVEQAPQGSIFPYEVKSRPGLRDYLFALEDGASFPPGFSAPENGEFVQAVFASPGVAGGNLYYQAYGRMYVVDEVNNVTTLNLNLPELAFGGDRSKGPHFVAANETLVYLHGGTFLFEADGSFGTLQINQPEDIADITYLNGKLVAIEEGTGRFHWTAPFNFTTFEGLGFATAESAGDTLLGIEAMNNEVYLFGAASLERWTDTGAETASTFQRSPGGVVEIGLLAPRAKIQAAGGIFWVSQRTGQYKTRQVLLTTGGAPRPISNPSVEQDLEKLEFRDLNSVHMWSYGNDGHIFIVLDADDKWTWVYDTKFDYWAKYNTLNRPNWEANGSAIFFGVQLFASRNRPAVMLGEPANTDGLGAYNKVVSVQVPHIGDQRSIDTVGIDMAPLDQASLMSMEVSVDRGKTWRAPRTITVEPRAGEFVRPIWRRMGSVPPGGCTVRITWSTGDPVAVSGLHFNEANYG